MLARNQPLNADLLLGIQGKKIDMSMGMQGPRGIPPSNAFPQNRLPLDQGMLIFNLKSI